jgi:hypothetical protein
MERLARKYRLELWNFVENKPLDFRKKEFKVSSLSQSNDALALELQRQNLDGKEQGSAEVQRKAGIIREGLNSKLRRKYK